MIFFIKIKIKSATQYYSKYSTILSINIKDIIICVVSIIIFLLIQSIHLKNIIIYVLNIIIFLIIQSIYIKILLFAFSILLFFL
jgi:hypothetical protein